MLCNASFLIEAEVLHIMCSLASSLGKCLGYLRFVLRYFMTFELTWLHVKLGEFERKLMPATAQCLW